MLVWRCIIIICVLTGSCESVTQDDLDFIASFINVTMQPIDNTAVDTADYVKLNLTLHNVGYVDVTHGDWRIYFNIMYGIKVEDTACNLYLRHLNGLLYYLSPSTNFSLPSHTAITCELHMRIHGSARSDFMPNWYVSSRDLSPRILKSTSSDELTYVGAFDSPQKWKSNKRDRYRPLSLEERFIRNKKTLLDRNTTRLIPSVLEMSEVLGFMEFDDQWKISNTCVFPRAAALLLKLSNISVIKSKDQERKVIEFVNESVHLFNGSREGYRITVNKTREVVRITASSETGAFYAVQTIGQMLQISDKGKSVLPEVTIYDIPRYEHRGLMIDIARNYHGESIKDIIDIMARYKMNKLHLHVADDEGWRLEIPSIPQLTVIGSKRCHSGSHQPNHCLIPSHGSGPFTNTSGSGYLTVGQFREILQHAEDNHVSVILEIDMPGHSRAAWRSLNTHQESNAFIVDDLDDIGEGEGTFTQRWKRSSLNPCLESTYVFVDTVVSDIVDMYDGIQDINTLHIGGDEVVFAEWMKSKACQNNFTDKTMGDLKTMFIQKVIYILRGYGIVPILWEDGLYENGNVIPNTDALHGPITAQTWYNTWELGRGSRPIELANGGYNVIMSPATHLYLDHTQEPDPEERGVYYATRFADTHKVFSFNSRDIYKNIDTSRFGEPLSKGRICKQFSFPELLKPLNIKGIEACLWSETIRTADHLYTMMFPRVLAVAERSWHEASWESIENITQRNLVKNEDWNSFRRLLGNKHLGQLPFYRIPPPGAVWNGSHVFTNTFYENHDVEISLDCKSNWSVVNYSVRLPETTTMVCLRSKPSNKRIYSRTMKLNVEELIVQKAMNRCGSFNVHLVSYLLKILAAHMMLYKCVYHSQN